MLKKFLRLTISLPLIVVFGALSVITLYIVFGFLAVLVYFFTGFDVEILKYTMQIPNHFKDGCIELIENLFYNL